MGLGITLMDKGLWIWDKKNGIGYIRLKTVDKGWEIRDMGSILDQSQIHSI